ncbi:hr1 [Heliothis virescens ascovirus 3f]|uniref:Hr1 n=2 Tax=Heliothis virescens ascovirus 3f TaxID=328614 RepID=A0A171PVJ2_9VIRU|nr:hr1 [Heliothis virescens ascovirus 3f]AJP09061.1 hr1 [Heliothis virescens ascovirus 3f]
MQLSCKSCGGEGHSRRSSKSCANYLPPIRQRRNSGDVDHCTQDFDVGVVKQGLDGTICPLLREDVRQRLTAEIRSDVVELSKLYILLGVFVNHCWNAYPDDESNSVRTFQDMMNYVYALKGKGPHAQKFDDMVRYHGNIRRYDGRLRTFIVQEVAKTYWTVLKTNISRHAYSRLARYFGVKRNDPTLFAAYYHKEFGDDDSISRVCRFINVSSDWHSTIPMWIEIQRDMYARGEQSFVIFPQPGHGLKHVSYTSRGWHELLRRVDPSNVTSNWTSITDHKKELWVPYLDTCVVDMKKFGCCIQTDGVAVSISMNRPKIMPIRRKAALPKSYTIDAFFEDRIVAVDPGSRVPVAACDSRAGFKRITKRWVRSHTLEWKRDRYRSRKLRRVELDEAADRQRVELDRGVQITCRNGEQVKLYTDFRLKWFDARQRPFERTRKLTRLSFNKYMMTARTNERIVRETFLSDAPSDRVLVLYGAGVNFVNVACYSGRKFKHTDLLRRLRAKRNIRVRLIDESYTSKACSDCNELRNGTYTRLRMNHRLRRGVCPDCNADVERDYNAAKNILVNYQRSAICRPSPSCDSGVATDTDPHSVRSIFQCAAIEPGS